MDHVPIRSTKMPTVQFVRHNCTLFLKGNEPVRAYLAHEFGNQRFIRNYFIQKNIEKYEAEKKFIFYNEMSRMLTIMKKQPEFEFLNKSNSQALQQTLRNLGTRHLKNSTEYPAVPDDCPPDLTAGLVMDFANDVVGLSTEKMDKLKQVVS